MLHEVVRIAHAVALDVRAVRILRIGPPVVAFGEEIVLAAGAPRTAGSGHRDRRFVEVLVGGLQHAGPLDGGEVELSAVRATRMRAGRVRRRETYGDAYSSLARLHSPDCLMRPQRCPLDSGIPTRPE